MIDRALLRLAAKRVVRPYFEDPPLIDLIYDIEPDTTPFLISGIVSSAEHHYKWRNRFMGIARTVSTWSKDPSTKVGALIISEDRREVAWGYNGFPPSIEDDERLDNRELRHKMTTHAELNALLNCKFDPVGATMYVWGCFPCPQCAAAIIQKGLAEVYFCSDVPNTRWDPELSQKMFDEAGVEHFSVYSGDILT